MKRLIVLDVDGTLYDINDVIAANYDIQIDFLEQKTGKTRGELICYLEKNYIFPVPNENSKSATELFVHDGFSARDWNAFRDARFPVDKIDVSRAATSADIVALGEFGNVVLLSSNSFSTISRILSRLAISIDCIDAIVCTDRYSRSTPFAKIDAMADLLLQFGVEGKSLISIGDRYNTDIRPALKMGGCGVLVKNAEALPVIVHDIADDCLATCDDYGFYDGRPA